MRVSDTLRALRAHRHELIDPLIDEHGGRIANTAGDSLLLEFASVVDAVRCALAMQQAMVARNRDFDEDRQIHFRIGINVGDVVAEGDDLLGEGVNLAARLEGLAESGGICRSASAHDHAVDKIDAEFVDGGEHRVKNIDRPVRIWCWRPGASADLAFVLAPPDKPSIAVLPFDNMSGDTEQEYFADGITEDIITELSRYAALMVIARHSTFAYKGRRFDVKDVARELGVRYVLEGSVRKAGARIRVTAQLIEAKDGSHLWAERFDRDLEDIFAVQDEIAQVVAGTLMPKLLAAGASRVMKEDPARLNAYDLVLRALAHWHRFTRADHEEAGGLATAAIEIDPSYARAYAVLSMNTLQLRNSGFTDYPEAFLAAGHDAARKAVSLDDNDAAAHLALAMLCLFTERHEQSIEEGRRAIELNPNYADVRAHLANALTFSGRTEEAAAELKTAMRLNPHHPVYYLMMLGRNHYTNGDFDAAIPPLDRAVSVTPQFTPARTTLAACYAASGRLDEARAQIGEIRAYAPGLTLEFVRAVMPFKDRGMLDRFIADLRMAGLVDG